MSDTHTTAKPTYRLRWVPRSMMHAGWVPCSMMQAGDYKLQQAWETVHYEGPRPVRIETEWRDIPYESNP